MNVYRSSPVSASPVIVRRRHPAVRRKTLGFLLVALGATAIGPAIAVSTLAMGASAATIVVGIVLAIVGRSRTPHTRLCALTWSRGDRFGALMLFFGVIQPRYSKKRLARNRAAVAAVSATCIKYPKARLFPFQL